MTMSSPRETTQRGQTTSNTKKNHDNDGGKTINAMKQKSKVAPSRIECPCHNYTALSKIVDIISSEDRCRTDSMIEWLNGGTDRIALREKKLLTCGKRFKCRYRYGTSFWILRAIRDATAPFQNASKVAADSTSTGSQKEIRTDKLETPTKEVPASRSYDQSFPPLSQHPGISNILIPPTQKSHEKAIETVSKKSPDTNPVINTLKARKKKPKKRVQTQLTAVSTSALPNPQFAVSPFQKDAEHKSKSDGGRSNLSTTDKKDTKDTSRVVNVLNATKIKPKRVQPQLTAVKVESSSLSSSLPVDISNLNITEATEIPKPSLTEEQMTQKTDVVKTSTKSLNQFSKAATEQMDRLVDIYIALLRNMLIPSTPLEIHLLLELLLIDTNTTRSESQGCILKQPQKINDDNEQASVTQSVATNATAPTTFFQPIFYSPERCIEFARKVMTRHLEGIIQRLSPFLIKSLLGESVFVRRCPTVAEHLNMHLLKTTTAIEWTPPTSESITGTHAIFSLPFEPDRDSRHNFKTQAEISMYQNRELTRDAFLSQLRVFITAKSKVFLPQEVDKVRETAQYESKKIIANILPHNIMWFAQFFCELLLQVGLAPVEEMDQELLQIANDREKVQKLHKRLFEKKNPSRPSQSRTGFGTSTTSGHRTERYRNFNNGNRNEIKSSTISAFQEAIPHFPGYQEFFFIFLYSVDSYNFGTHLVHQLVKKTSDMISNQSLPGLEKRILDLGLLARFLGCLVFSPNWHEENIDLNKLKPCLHSLDHGLDLLETSGLSLSKLVQESWDGGYTFLVIPWVAELLKMSKWDSISQSSMTFRQILANLRYVQLMASRANFEDCGSCESNMLQVFFYLETFFNEIFSLPKLTSLPDPTLKSNSQSNEQVLDNNKIGLSKAAIYASSPHMEDLCDMIMISKVAKRRETKNSNTKPKKLKPSVVSATLDTEARSYLGVESPRAKLLPTPKKSAQKGVLTDNTLQGKKIHAKNKLAEDFFHQHRDLKEICDFVVQQIVKGLASDEIGAFVKKASEEFSVGTQSSEMEIEEMQAKAFEESQRFVQRKLSDQLRKSLALFCGTDVQQKVIDVATNLSTNRGLEASRAIVRELIASSTKTILKQLGEASATLNHDSDKIKSDIDQATSSATESIRNLTEKYSLILDDDSLTKYTEEALEHVGRVTNSSLIPSEAVLRIFFDCILDLDPIAELVIKRFIESSNSESWAALCSFFHLLKRIALISGYWRIRIDDFFGDDLVKLISSDNLPSSSEREKMIENLKTSSVILASDEDESKYKGMIDPKTIAFD